MDQTCNCEHCDLKELFFSSLDASAFESICSKKYELSFKKGQTIFSKGDEIKQFIYLKSGLVKLYREQSQNKTQIISIAKPLDYVSLLSIFSSSKYKYSVTAIEDSVTCNIDFNLVKSLLEKNGKFAFHMVQQMSKVYDKIIIDTLDIRQKQLKGRLANILLYFAEHIYFNNTFELPISRREIAELSGVSTENIIRTMSEFRKDKLIRINGKEIEITNLEMLKKIDLLG